MRFGTVSPLAVLLLLAACASPRPSALSRASALDPVAWLVGTWQGEAGGMPFYEEWQRRGDSALVNLTYSWCGADTTGTIVTPLRLGADGRWTFGRQAPLWTATTAEPGRLVLESPTARYSQRIVHTRSPGGHWIAELYTNGALTRYDLAPDVPIATRRRQPVVPLTGTFRGTLSIDARTVPFGVRFDDGQVLALRDGAAPAPAGAVCVDGPHVRFPFPELGNVQARLAGDSLNATFRRGPTAFRLRLFRADQ